MSKNPQAASLPQPTAGSTGASKLPEWHLKEREELLVKMDAMTGFWEVAAARELHRLYLTEDECASTPAQSVLMEALRKSREKIILYRQGTNGEYPGGMEYSALIKLIDAALAHAPSQPAPVVIPRAIDLPDAAREVMARYERSYHGSEVFPTLRMWDEVANVLASSNRPQATEPKWPEYKCAGGVEIAVGPCPKCGATDNDVCLFANFPLTDEGG